MPSPEARKLALETEKDPRLVHLILQESTKVIRSKPGMLITEHRLGFIMAGAGIDASNVGQAGCVILLPKDPDNSAQQIAKAIKTATGLDVDIMITDSWGRAWRLGTAGFAIGSYGVPTVIDMRGIADLDGRPLETTTIGVGDELAAAASLLMGQAAEGIPVVIIRGYDYTHSSDTAADLIRPAEGDMFR